MRKPTLQRTDVLKTQRIYRFPNGYGASVVMGPYTYGGSKGLWELAVIRFFGSGPDDFNLVYETPITDDVLGYLTEAEVDNYLKRIENLPKVEEP